VNTNLIHNILNIAIAIVAALSVPEISGILPPEWGVAIAGFLSTAKVVLNVIRDGLTGLVKEQPPVK
jgi:hypothetical protein